MATRVSESSWRVVTVSTKTHSVGQCHLFLGQRTVVGVLSIKHARRLLRACNDSRNMRMGTCVRKSSLATSTTRTLKMTPLALRQVAGGLGRQICTSVPCAHAARSHPCLEQLRMNVEIGTSPRQWDVPRWSARQRGYPARVVETRRRADRLTARSRAIEVEQRNASPMTSWATLVNSLNYRSMAVPEDKTQVACRREGFPGASIGLLWIPARRWLASMRGLHVPSLSPAFSAFRLLWLSRICFCFG